MTTDATNRELREALEQADGLLDDLLLKSESRRVQAMLKRIDDNSIRILLIGEFGRGKTTFLNALLGSKILAASALPTPTINVLRWADLPSARIATGDVIRDAPIDSLVGETPDRVELHYPLTVLRNNVELIEMPSVWEADAQEVEAQIESADIVVVALACDALYSASDVQLVERLKAAGHRELFFLCNFFDRIASEEVEAIRRSAFIRIPANRDRIFFTSPTRALEGNEAAQASLREVITALTHIVETNPATLKSDRAARLLREAVKLSREHTQTLQAQAAAHQEDQQTRSRALNTAYEATTSASRQIGANLDEFQAQTRDVVQSMASGFIRGLSLQVETWLREYSGDDPAGLVEGRLKESVAQWYLKELTPYLREQTNRQITTLAVSIDQYRLSLQRIRELLPAVSEDFQPSVMFNLPDLTEIGFRSGVKPLQKPGKQSVPLTQMPEVLLLATASLAAMFLLQPLILGVPVGVAGMGLAVALASRKTQMATGHSDAAQAYAAEIRMQADPLARSVWDNINQRIEALKTQLENVLKVQNDAVREEVRAEMERIGDVNTGATHNDTRLTQLESFVQSLPASEI